MLGRCQGGILGPLKGTQRLDRNLGHRYKSEKSHALPLTGIRVLELGQLIAGPFTGSLLGHYGADVIKVEPPHLGDPLRVWRELDVDGVSPWFRSLARNKKSITVDLRKEEGRRLIRQLALKSDVLVENFKPGTLERWKLGPEHLHPENPALIFTRISGYGQTGPYSSKGGYASVCEGMGGFRYLNGQVDATTGLPSGAPTRPNLSLGDSLAGIHAAFGTVLALLAREKIGNRFTGRGQTVDVAIYESVLNMLEGVIPEYDRKGKIRGPSGSSVSGIVPTNAYQTSDLGTYVIIGGNGDSIYKRLMQAIGRADLTGEGYHNNAARVLKQDEIEEAITSWTSQRSAEDILRVMESSSVPAGKIYNAQDIVEDEHIKARGMIETVRVGQGETAWHLKVPGVSPVLEQGGQTRWAGPDLGAHNGEILRGVLGLSNDAIEKLVQDDIVQNVGL